MSIQHPHSTLRRSALAAVLAAAVLGSAGFAGAAAAAPPASTQPDLHCKLAFSLTGWSAIYEHADGRGTVTCANGAAMPVHIRVRGGGLTAGKWRINDGKGTFTDVFKINEVLGSYAQAAASAGVVKSGTAQVLSKGTVSLALAGAGQGINLGISGAKFTISRAGSHASK